MKSYELKKPVTKGAPRKPRAAAGRAPRMSGVKMPHAPKMADILKKIM